MYATKNVFTLTSFSVNISLVNVLFTTAGLFLTLGKIMPPFRTTDFVGVVFHVEEEEAVTGVALTIMPSILLIFVLEEVD